MTQWTNPTKSDWTETVRVNLEEFEVPCDFDFLKTMSKENFKRKAKIVALANLKKKQAAHSKMRNLEYSKLELQSYLKLPGIKVDMPRNLFKFRTRMAPFGENFRGNQELITCLLCDND